MQLSSMFTLLLLMLPALRLITAATEHQIPLRLMPPHTVLQQAHTRSSQSKMSKINLNSQIASITRVESD